MSSPDKEKVRVVFYITDGSLFNFEGIKPEVDCFSKLLASSPSDRNTFYMDSMTLTSQEADAIRTQGRTERLVDPILSGILRSVGKLPAPEDLRRYEAVISQHGFGSLEQSLIPPEVTRELFLNLGLQRLNLPFEMGYESHPEEGVWKIQAHLAAVQTLNRYNNQAWRDGKINEIISNRRGIYALYQAIALLREPDLTTDLSKITSTLLFCPVNAPYRMLAHSLQTTLGANPDIDFQVIDDTVEESPARKIQRCQEKGIEAADECHAQDYFDDYITTLVQQNAFVGRRLSKYGESYQTLAETISNIAASFSLQEIEALSRKGRNVRDVLIAHPLATPLLPFISSLVR